MNPEQVTTTEGIPVFCCFLFGTATMALTWWSRTCPFCTRFLAYFLLVHSSYAIERYPKIEKIKRGRKSFLYASNCTTGNKFGLTTSCAALCAAWNLPNHSTPCPIHLSLIRCPISMDNVRINFRNLFENKNKLRTWSFEVCASIKREKFRTHLRHVLCRYTESDGDDDYQQAMIHSHSGFCCYQWSLVTADSVRDVTIFCAVYSFESPPGQCPCR